MINQRLKEMEELGLIERCVITERPIAVEYSITAFGRSSLAVLEELKNWAEENNI